MHADIGSFVQPFVVILFVIIMFLSQLAKAKQKQKQAETEPNRRGTGPQSATPEEQSNDHTTTNDGRDPIKKEEPSQLKRTLDEIFGELGIPVPGEQEPNSEKPHGYTEPQKNRPAEETVTKNKRIDSKEPKQYPVSVSVATAAISAVQKDANAAYDSASPLTEKNIYAVSSSVVEEERSLLGKYDAKELQRLVIWSEILAKPKALQEEN